MRKLFLLVAVAAVTVCGMHAQMMPQITPDAQYRIGKLDNGLTYYIIISIMVGLNYINLNTGQLSVLVPEFITVVLLCRNGTVNHNGDRFRLLNFRCSRCLLRRLCLAIGSGIR